MYYENIRWSRTLSNDLGADVQQFLLAHDAAKTAEHVRQVAEVAGELALRFGADAAAARCGGYLHDISVIIPNEERIALAQSLGIDVLPEEARFPMIIHQKLSAFIAEAHFGISDAAILSAIGCHTTLKRDASRLDKIVFIADKIAWDQAGSPPYLADLQQRLDHSLDAGVHVYLDYLWQMRDQLRVLHPWLAEAYAQSETLWI